MPRRIIEPNKRADLASTLRQQYEDGLSVRKVADTHGLSYNLTYRLLREAATQMRPAPHSSRRSNQLLRVLEDVFEEGALVNEQGKLVRDRIPQIIREDGSEPVTYTAGPHEYRRRLRDKLEEEVTEFLAADEAGAPEELADVLEVVRAIAADLGIDADQLEKIRATKANERGGFADRIVLTGKCSSGSHRHGDGARGRPTRRP